MASLSMARRIYETFGGNKCKKNTNEGIKGFKKKSKGSERYLAPAILHNKSTP